MSDSGTRRPPSEQQQVVEWTGFAYAIAADYTLPGGTSDDARQESLVGLLSGIRSWQPEKGAPLKMFLGFAIRRHLITALKSSRRMKHRPLTEALRGTRDVDGDGEPREIFDTVPDELADPHRQLVGRLELHETIAQLPRLTELEARCLLGFAVGLSYDEIGPTKQVDNAIARGRRKLLRAA